MKMKLFLSSSEYLILEVPRIITQYEWAAIDRRDCLIVEIDNPIDGKRLGGIDDPTTKLYLVNYFTKDRIAFRQLNTFPLSVYVLIRKAEFHDSIPTFKEFANIAWASLYDNLEDAKNHRIV